MSEEVVSPLRVLIVDDDPRILTVFAKELDAQLTISVCATAAGGEHALDTPVVEKSSYRRHSSRHQHARPQWYPDRSRHTQESTRPSYCHVHRFQRERTLSEALTEGVKGFITKDEKC